MGLDMYAVLQFSLSCHKLLVHLQSKILSIVFKTNMEMRQNKSIENGEKLEVVGGVDDGGDYLFCLPQAIIEQLKVVQNSGNLNKFRLLEYCKYV